MLLRSPRAQPYLAAVLAVVIAAALSYVFWPSAGRDPGPRSLHAFEAEGMFGAEATAEFLNREGTIVIVAHSPARI